MYVPSKFQLTDKTELLDFMQRFSFATIITTKNNIPIATQLPFVIKQREDKLILSAHFAIANEQVNYIEDTISLVIFSEPHAYISPSHYDKLESVPTWDYISVHVYGKAKILHTTAEKMQALEDMIHFYEKDYYEQWKSLSEKYIQGMLKCIVAFELEVTEVQGQQKLSQNKSQEVIGRIVQHLENSEIQTEKDLAKYILKASKL